MSLSSKKCCVPGCMDSGKMQLPLHLFPNPVKDKQRFNTWVISIGGDIVGMDCDNVYKLRRVCHAHFEEKFCCRYDRLSNIALPTINLTVSTALQSQMSPQMPLQEVQNLTWSFPSTSTVSTALQSQMSPQRQQKAQEVKNLTKSSPSTSTVSAHKAPWKKIHKIHSTAPSTSTVSTALQSRISPRKPLQEVQNLTKISPSTSTDLGDKENINIPMKARSTQNIMKSRSKKITPKKIKSRVNMTNNEEILYKKLAAMKVKISRCKSREKKHLVALKAAQRITSNPNLIKITENFTSTAKILTFLQFREGKKKLKGRRFELKEKIIALSIFKQSPKAYRFLRKIFILPAPQVLAKLISDAMLTPGINKSVFAQLKNKATKMKTSEKLCIVLFDEISIKPGISYNEKKDKITGFVTDTPNTTQRELADHCLVFMIKGLIKNYKQPVVYSFCSGSTKTHSLVKQIKEVLNNLLDAGFIPLATVCDQGASNQSAIKYLIQDSKRDFLIRGQNINKNVFYVSGQEIIPLYDPPHLLKGIRNNLLTKDLKYIMNGKSGTAKWAHIELLFKENPGYKGIRLIPKLTENHVVPEKIGKMKVKYASQTFSATVSANMGYLADKGILPEETKETADILKFYDDLFDSVNGSIKKNKFAKPLLGPVKPNSIHHKQWKDSIMILKCMKFVGSNANRDVPSLQNWVWTLEGCEVLIKKLEAEYDITSIWMRHLNQDALENFFGAIRSQGCRNINPTAAAFESAYASLLINNLSSLHAPGANCEQDLSEALCRFIIPDSSETEPITSREVNMDHLNITFTPLHLKNDDPRIIGPLTYVSGYMVRQAKKKIFRNCNICNGSLISGVSDYIKRREYGPGWLCTPSNGIINLISNIQDIIYNIKNEFNQNHLKTYLKTLCLILIDFNVLECEKHNDLLKKYLLDLCIRFFLHNYCKDINKIISGKRAIDDTEDDLKNKANKICKRSIKRKK